MSDHRIGGNILGVSAGQVIVKSAAALVNYELRRGDTLILTHLVETMVDPEADPGDPATEWQPDDMTGSTWRCQVRLGSEHGQLVRSLVVDTSNQDSGLVAAPFGETSSVYVGIEYFYDLERTTVDGAIFTLVAGWIVFDPDVSRDEP